MGKILSIDIFNQEKHIFKYNGQIFKNIFKLIIFPRNRAILICFRILLVKKYFYRSKL